MAGSRRQSNDEINNRLGLLEDTSISYSPDVTSFTTSSATFVDVTGMSIAKLVTSNRPLMIAIQPISSGAVSYLFADSVGSNAGHIEIQLLRDSTVLGAWRQLTTSSAGGNTENQMPPSAHWMFDAPGEGTFTYKIQVRAQASSSVQVINCRLAIIEL